MGDYYRVPQREVVIIRERGMPYEELPVVYFIAGRARVVPEIIVTLRLGGMSWMDVTLRFGMTPEIYYVPVRVGPPYGKAYGYYDSVGKPRTGTNLYQYAGNNPVNYIDPMGLKEKKCDDCDQCTVWCGCELRVCACSENRCGKVSFLGLFTIDPLGGIVGLRVFSCDEFYGVMKSQPQL